MLHCSFSARVAGSLSSELPEHNRQTWGEEGGLACAHGVIFEHEVRIYVPDVGVCEIDRRTRRAVFSACETATPTLVQDALYRVVLPLALPALGYEVLHASAVWGRRGVLALAAVSGTGKSTVACAMAQHDGIALWADDAVVVDVSSDEARTLALPFRPKLLPDAAGHLGRPSLKDRVVPEQGAVSLELSVPLVGLLLLERGSHKGPVQLERLTPLQALRGVLPHAYAFNVRDPEMKRGLLQTYTRLSDMLPIYRAVLPNGLEHVTSTARDLLHLVD